MNYEFIADWVTPHIPMWTELTKDLVGKDGVRILEIGSYEGRSACWWLDNVLTGPYACLVCIDPFRDPDNAEADWVTIKQRFQNNTRHRAHLYQSITALQCNNPGTFDLVYIDGSHRALAVLSDACAAWPMLKPGGIMLFDDYEWPVPWADKNDCVATAVEAFLGCVRRFKTIHQGWQVVIQKVAR